MKKLITKQFSLKKLKNLKVYLCQIYIVKRSNDLNESMVKNLHTFLLIS